MHCFMLPLYVLAGNFGTNLNGITAYVGCFVVITCKVPITNAADDTLNFFFFS